MTSHLPTAFFKARTNARPQRSKDPKPSMEAITKAFTQTSRDGSELLRTRELQVAVRSLGLDMPKEKAVHLVANSQNATREGGAGGIPFHQFVAIIEAAVQEAALHKELINTFQLFKEEKQLFANSRIFLEDLLRIRNTAAPYITDQQVKDMYDVAKLDSDEEGGITIDEFCSVLRAKGYFVSCE